MRHGLALIPWLVFAAAAPAQHPQQPPVAAVEPLLFVRFSHPPGLHVTFYQQRAGGDDYAVPVTVGLRPGYIYRLQLTGFNPGSVGAFHAAVVYRKMIQ